MVQIDTGIRETPPPLIYDIRMPRIYRSMKKDGDHPLLDGSATALGVRVGADQNDDISVDNTGKVHPGPEGMSVAPRLRDLAPHRVPKRLRGRVTWAIGSDKCFVWRHGTGGFENEPVAESLNLHVTNEKHGVVAPSAIMELREYIRAINRTLESWEIDEN